MPNDHLQSIPTSIDRKANAVSIFMANRKRSEIDPSQSSPIYARTANGPRGSKSTNEKQLKNNIKNERSAKKINTIKDKRIHGQYFTILELPHINKRASIAWLKSSTLKRSTESTICAIQENAISTKYMKKHIYKTTDDDTCRACKQFPETVQHVMSKCPILAPTKYLERHDNVCKYFHVRLAKKLGFVENLTKWYEYEPEPILENVSTKILWNFMIQTDRPMKHNKPDITVLDKEARVVYLIDVAIPTAKNITRKINEKITNYADIAIEIKQLWNVRTVKTVPIIIGACGEIHENFEKSITEKLNIEINTKEIQHIVLLSTANISRYFFSADF